MIVKLFTNATIIDATEDMLSSIDKSDFSAEHIVVVPDKYSLQAEKTILKFLGDSLFNVRVVGLTKLASELLDEMGIKTDVVSESESLLLTQKAIDEVADNFLVFKKGSFGFCEEMKKLISQIKSSCVGIGELSKNLTGLVGGKYHDIALVYEKYNEFLGGRLDANGKLMLASRFAGEKNLKNRNFYFGYFDAFTSEGFKLIESLISLSQSVSFACPTPLTIGNEYLYDKDIKDKVLSLAKKHGASVKVINGKTDFSPVKTALLQGVLSYQKVNNSQKGFCQVLGARSIDEEVEGVAKIIYYLLHKGLKYRDIVVKVSDEEKYKDAIKRVFDKYDFTYFLDETQSAGDTIIARAVKDFFVVAFQGYQKGDLVKLFVNPLFGDNTLLAQKVLDKNISGKRKYKIYLAEDFSFDCLFDEFEKCSEILGFCGFTRKLLLAIENNLTEFLSGLGEDYIKDKNFISQSYDKILESIDLLEKYNAILSPDEFFLRLSTLLGMTNLSSPPTYVDAIAVSNLDSSMEKVKVSFLLGSEGLPVVAKESGLISDEELEKNMKEISPTITMINRRNRFKLFQFLSMAEKSLILTYQLTNEEGKKNELPTFVRSIMKIFGQNEEKMSDFFEAGQDHENGVLLSTGGKENFIKENYFALKTEEKEILGIKNLERANDYLCEKLAGNSDLFFEGGKFSSSGIETYFNCPFKHFARYGLRLKEKMDNDFSAIQIGNICHDMAEVFVKNFDKLKHDILKFVNSQFDKTLAKLELKEMFDECEDKKVLRKYLTNYLVRFLGDVKKEREQSGFKPLLLESNISGVEVDGVSLKGRVDRVDEADGYFRIVDYKTGKTKGVLKELYFGTKLQLFLYSSAVRSMLKMPCAGLVYFNGRFDYAKGDEDKTLLKGIVQKDENIIPYFDSELVQNGKSKIIDISSSSGKDIVYKGRALAKEDISFYEKYALDISKKAIEEIKQGYIEPKPCMGACERCKFRPLCRFCEEKGERLFLDGFDFKE